MAWGPKNSLQMAYLHVNHMILETEPIKAQFLALLDQDMAGAGLCKLWTKCKAHYNDLSNIRTLIPGIMDYAKGQHPADYDIEGKWLACEAVLADVLAEVEKLIPNYDGSEIEYLKVRYTVFPPGQTKTVKAKVAAFPRIDR